MATDLYEKCHVWPIHVECSVGKGYTLWGDGNGDEDRVLAVSQKLRLFPLWEQLFTFVRSSARCNLSGLSGYEELLKEWRGSRSPPPVFSACEYPLVKVE